MHPPKSSVEKMIEWAVTATGALVRAAEGPFEGPLTCYGCGGALAFKEYYRGATRVVPHFQHTHGSCEGAAHKMGKLLAATKPFTWLVRASCGHLHRVELPGVPQLCEMQWCFEGQTYQLDVPLVADGVIVGAIEVHDSHACSEAKRDAMTRGLSFWIEVEAADLLKWAPGYTGVVARWHTPLVCVGAAEGSTSVTTEATEGYPLCSYVAPSVAPVACRHEGCHNLLERVVDRTSWHHGGLRCYWCKWVEPRKTLHELVVAQYAEVDEPWREASWHGRLPPVPFADVRKVLRAHERSLGM